MRSHEEVEIAEDRAAANPCLSSAAFRGMLSTRAKELVDKENTMDTTKPIKTFREGNVGASVWLRQTKAGVFYDVTFARSWKDELTGKMGYSQSFNDLSLGALARVAGEVDTWIAHQKANAEVVRLGGEDA